MYPGATRNPSSSTTSPSADVGRRRGRRRTARSVRRHSPSTSTEAPRRITSPTPSLARVAGDCHTPFVGSGAFPKHHDRRHRSVLVEDDASAAGTAASEKPLEEFPLQKGGRFGRHPLCKPCRAAQERRRYERDRERLLAQKRARPERVERARRRRTLERKYGLSPARVRDALRARSADAAPSAGCGPTACTSTTDHTTGEVRGLLCSNCNFAVGDFGDDPDRCEQRPRYLDESSNGLAA